MQLVAVGTKMPSWVQQGYDEYAKRLPGELKPKLIELPLAHRGKSADIGKAREAEGEAILQASPPGFKKVVLDVGGKAWSTAQLAQQLATWRMSGVDLSFVIGGPDGLSPACKRAADATWSLSNLTLPHPLVRIVFIEQWYRAYTILHNHPYHK